MPFGIGVGQVLALVRETRAIESSHAYIALSGPRAHELAAALAEDGERVVVNDLKGETADEVVARIKESGGEATAAPGDSGRDGIA